MVGLHVVDDQIVDCAVSDNFGDVVQQTVGIGGIGRIDQNILFVGNQIGVVGNSVRERPKVLELVFTAVVDSYIVYSFCDFCYLHNPIKLTRYDINSNLAIGMDTYLPYKWNYRNVDGEQAFIPQAFIFVRYSFL